MNIFHIMIALSLLLPVGQVSAQKAPERSSPRSVSPFKGSTQQAPPRPKTTDVFTAKRPAPDGKPVSASERFFWGRVKFNVDPSVPDQWDVHPLGDTFFLQVLKEYTQIEVDENFYVAALADLDELVKHPFLFMTADGDFECSRQELANLKEYLLRGGFLFADDCVFKTKGDLFFTGFKNKIEKTFGQKMVQLPPDHEIYHCVFDLPAGLPHMQGVPHGGWALFLDGRMAIFLSPSDIHCGWVSHYKSRFQPGKIWFPVEQSELAVKMGVNIVVYAMTH